MVLLVENGMAKAISRLPHFDPFMLVNLSGTCACSRLLQIRYQGLLSVNLEQKLTKEARQPGPDFPEPFQCTRAGDFRLMLKLVQSMKKLTGDDEEWIPILYEWQLVESIGRKTSDYGQLVFCDTAAKRFVIVEMCFCPCIHLKERALNRAHLLFCLARYIGFDPTWVRFTIATKDDKKPTLPAEIFAEGTYSTLAALL
ncbi:g10761 [Coccomyxa elongata]